MFVTVTPTFHQPIWIGVNATPTRRLRNLMNVRTNVAEALIVGATAAVGRSGRDAVKVVLVGVFDEDADDIAGL